MSARQSLMKHVGGAVIAVAALAATPPVAAHLIDTGTPTGAGFPLAFDSNDYYAGQVRFAGTATIDNVFAHVVGALAGETFTIALYSDNAAHLPGSALFSSTGTVGTSGFSGVTGLSGWNVPAGLYWVAFEVGFGDTLGSDPDDIPVLDLGAPNPLTRTAFNAGSGYQLATPRLTFGLQLDARVVPEPDTMGLLFGGMALILAFARRAFR